MVMIVISVGRQIMAFSGPLCIHAIREALIGREQLRLVTSYSVQQAQ